MTNLDCRTENLDALLQRLQQLDTLKEKNSILDQCEEVQEFTWSHSFFNRCIQDLNFEEEFVIKSLLVIGQGAQVFSALSNDVASESLFKNLLKVLIEMESIYEAIGGIIGYQLTILKLILAQQKIQSTASPNVRYIHPPFIDISKENLDTKRATLWGINALKHMAIIYPVGGAGDRLNLHDEHTGEALPAAELAFCGRTLLEGLIRDLQAGEYLHYKLHGKQLSTPIAMMTSHEKNNYQHIYKICNEQHWFGRSPKSFRFVIQPLVPVVTVNGDWVMQGPLQPLLKPGGHGVIWKLAEDRGVINWLLDQNYEQVLIRQINNPIASIDYGLFAFMGLGKHFKKKFGFASCPRLVNASEGMDVLREIKTSNGVEYCITNVEYTEFERCGIEDSPEKAGSPYSRFPANTNLLFADLREVQKVLKKCPIPGMLINMKTQVPITDAQGNMTHISAGRLESTMQNIADYITDYFSQPLETYSPTALSSLITYNERRKTIAVTKRSYIPGEPAHETPEGCYYELLQNHAELLSRYCRVQLPAMPSEADYLKKGPAFIFLYHPALGPLYQIIAQKIKQGTIAFGSEMQLEIAELEVENFSLNGSLIIHADSILGSKNHEGLICYGENSGKCTLQQVAVENRGVNWSGVNNFWKNQVERHESLQIILHGNAEFFAEHVTFKGDQKIEVPDGYRMVAEQDKEQVRFYLEKIHKPTWHWVYSSNDQYDVVLSKS